MDPGVLERLKVRSREEWDIDFVALFKDWERRGGEVTRLEVALRDVCIGHRGDCPCQGCKLAFRREKSCDT